MSGGDAADHRAMEPEGHLTETEEIADDLIRMSDEPATEEEVEEERLEEHKEQEEEKTKSEAVGKAGQQTK
jgi:putative ABC transport system ATP-binding protein